MPFFTLFSLYHIGRSKSHGQSKSGEAYSVHGQALANIWMYNATTWEWELSTTLKTTITWRESVIFTKRNLFVGKNKGPQPSVSYNLFVISVFLSLISCSFLYLAPSPGMPSSSFLTWSMFFHLSSSAHTPPFIESKFWPFWFKSETYACSTSPALSMLHYNDLYVSLSRRRRAPLNLLFLTLHVDSAHLYLLKEDNKWNKRRQKDTLSAFKTHVLCSESTYFPNNLYKWIWIIKSNIFPCQNEVT